MSRIRFKYNPKTLKYERVGLSILNILITVIGYLAMGTLFFVGLVFLQNYITESPKEKELRAENKALKQHKVILAGQLASYNQQLEELKDQDLALYNKLFETGAPVKNEKPASEKVDILVAGDSGFKEWLKEINSQSTGAINTAQGTSRFFHDYASISKEDLSRLFAMPSIVPVEKFEVDKLVSGFGTRINPFHKGNYHHDGVDIASARGTLVLASGHGQIITVKRSDLVAGYGNYVEIDHGHGIVTRYSHLDDINARIGQQVKKGQPIGTVGSTGGSVAPHLHYEVIVNNQNVEPVKFFMENLSADQFKEVVSRSKKMNQSLD
jgi:murein DD-endopeptidase MepM/ murein hydrolase activator NlpD